MISLSDYTSRDGLGLAELVARKKVTPEELVAAALDVTKGSGVFSSRPLEPGCWPHDP